MTEYYFIHFLNIKKTVGHIEKAVYLSTKKRNGVTQKIIFAATNF